MISVCVSVCVCVCACACARAPSILPARRHTEAQKGNHRAAAVAVLLSGSQILGAEGAEAAPARRRRFHRRRRHRRACGACFRLTVAASPVAAVSSAAAPAVTLLVAAPGRFAGATTHTHDDARCLPGCGAALKMRVILNAAPESQRAGNEPANSNRLSVSCIWEACPLFNVYSRHASLAYWTKRRTSNPKIAGLSTAGRVPSLRWRSAPHPARERKAFS